MSENPSKIKAVIFDLGKVLVGVDSTAPVTEFAGLLESRMEHDELEKQLYYGYTKTGSAHEKLHHQYHRGEISSREFFEGIKKLVGLPGSVSYARFKNIWPGRWTRNDPVIDILKKLHPYQRYLLSDTNELDIEWVMGKYPDIFEQFDEMFFSHRTGVDKKQDQAWLQILKVSGFEPEEHVFIDDREEYAERAKALGLCGILYTGAESLQKELIRTGVLI